MNANQKFEQLRNTLGAERLIDEIFQWFPTAKMDECLDDIARTWDVELEEPRLTRTRRPSPYERTRAAVYATGNKWQIENFEATH